MFTLNGILLFSKFLLYFTRNCINILIKLQKVGKLKILIVVIIATLIVVLSNNITSTNHNDAVDSDDGALGNTNLLGGFVIHNSALMYGFSQLPRVQAEYSLDYLATKLLGDYIGGAKLVQDASQTKCWGIVEDATTSW